MSIIKCEIRPIVKLRKYISDIMKTTLSTVMFLLNSIAAQGLIVHGCKGPRNIIASFNSLPTSEREIPTTSNVIRIPMIGSSRKTENYSTPFGSRLIVNDFSVRQYSPNDRSQLSEETHRTVMTVFGCHDRCSEPHENSRFALPGGRNVTGLQTGRTTITTYIEARYLFDECPCTGVPFKTDDGKRHHRVSVRSSVEVLLFVGMASANFRKENKFASPAGTVFKLSDPYALGPTEGEVIWSNGNRGCETQCSSVLYDGPPVFIIISTTVQCSASVYAYLAIFICSSVFYCFVCFM